MKFNEREMLQFVSCRNPDIEGRLQRRSTSNSGFREEFFKLMGNLLFYYRISERSQIEPQPAGVIVLENYAVRPYSSNSLSFAFELSFHDQPDKRHVLTARTEYDMHTWIRYLQRSSYQYWKEQYDLLTSKIITASQKKLDVSYPSSPNPTRVNPFQSLLLPDIAPPLPPKRAVPVVSPVPPSSSQPSVTTDDLITF